MPEYFKETSLLHSNIFGEGIRQISNEDQDRPICGLTEVEILRKHLSVQKLSRSITFLKVMIFRH
jgi:hypothetical protein